VKGGKGGFCSIFSMIFELGCEGRMLFGVGMVSFIYFLVLNTDWLERGEVKSAIKRITCAVLWE